MQHPGTLRAFPVSIGAIVAALAMALLLASPVGAAATLTTVLSGSEEVPGPGDTDGSGIAIVDIDAAAGTLCYTVVVSGIATPTAAHIHSGIDGTAGDVEVMLTTPAGTDPGPYSMDDCAENPADYQLTDPGDLGTIALLLADIEANPQNYYVNVHNADFAAGAVRGQLGVSVATTASSYINPDTGAATANTDVDPGSDCETPDQSDTQQVSPVGTTTSNVHNDACLFDALGFDVDTQASFEASGVGTISACPDPDMEGPKTSTNNGVICTQTGYQLMGAPGPFEYHARLNSEVPGTQTVVFCADPEGNGCADAVISDSITITWTAAVAAPTATAAPTAPGASALPNTGVPAADGETMLGGFAVILGVLALGSLGALGYRAIAVRRPR